jgi:sigma-B regulation protein RsbU (phosphoserine phosphatase)
MKTVTVASKDKHARDFEPKVIRSIALEKKSNLFINGIASGSFYVHGNAKVLDVYDDLREMDQVQAVGVTDQDMKTIGIILRTDFFSMLAKPYARDVMKTRMVSEVASSAEVIDSEINLLTVAENLTHRLREQDTSYYVIADSEERFKGIFSTKDLLICLSDMTRNDIILARKLQERLVKESDFVKGKNFKFVAAAISAKGVAGDFYSIKKHGKSSWILSVCDVSGKGIAASVITSVLWGMINIYDFRNGMKKFISELNAYLFQAFESEKFVTGIFLDYNDESRIARICDMGHAYIHLFRNGRCMRIRSKHSNFPLGIIPDIVPQVNAFKPQREDLFFIYTDGLIDQENANHQTYSMEYVSAIIKTNVSLPIEDLRDLILKDFKAFRGERHFNDDITFALIKFEAQDESDHDRP